MYLDQLSLLLKHGRSVALHHQQTNMQSESNAASNVSNPSSEGTSVTRSSNIPLPSSHVARTQSEVQLSLDQEVAEQRDVHMFYRLVNGIRERHTFPHYHAHAPDEHVARSESSIARILHTRRSLIDSTDNIMMHEEQPQQMLNPIRRRTSVTSASDSWSITGFDWVEPADDRQATTQEDVEEDEGVFALDL